MGILFGPAGNSQSFYDRGYKTSLQVPEYLADMQLNAYEYQCGRGVNIGTETASALGKGCREKDIMLSLHAPYYISLSGIDEEKCNKSVDYILQSARAANDMGAPRIVVHSGSCSKMTREEALALAMGTMKKALHALDEKNLGHVRICPETMGKINQLGTLDEVLELCTLDERMIPCIDFGHLNARTLGGIRTIEDYADIFDKIENKLGLSRLREFHAHFSKIAYTQGGEKCHLTFEDTEYGPNFEPLAEMLLRKGCSPTIICESAGTQAEDAKAMMQIYNQLKEKEA